MCLSRPARCTCREKTKTGCVHDPLCPARLGVVFGGGVKKLGWNCYDSCWRFFPCRTSPVTTVYLKKEDQPYFPYSRSSKDFSADSQREREQTDEIGSSP